MKMTMGEYQDACHDYEGYCKKCDEITKFSGCEPDAEEYECPECGEFSVYGIEEAMIMGWIDVG